MTHPYAKEAYAKGLSHIGRPLYVPEWDCYVLMRDICYGAVDAVGAYPLAILNDKADVAGGLERLRMNKCVSVTLVLDDFHRPPLDSVQKTFTMVSPFKTHYIYRPSKGAPPDNSYHKNMLKKALKTVQIKPVDLKRDEDRKAWKALYANLVQHRKLSGWHVFPDAYHDMLSDLDGVSAMGAWYDDTLVSCHVWIRAGACVHSHLAATSDEGYRTCAAYAVNHASLCAFQDVDAINLGGGIARIGDDSKTPDGLASFKRKFSNDTAQSYLCGAVLEKSAYDELTRKRQLKVQNSFFPAYRTPMLIEEKTP